MATKRDLAPVDVIVDALAGASILNVGGFALLMIDCVRTPRDHVHFFCLRCMGEVEHPAHPRPPLGMTELLHALEHHVHRTDPDDVTPVDVLRSHAAGKGGSLH